MMAVLKTPFKIFLLLFTIWRLLNHLSPDSKTLYTLLTFSPKLVRVCQVVFSLIKKSNKQLILNNGFNSKQLVIARCSVCWIFPDPGILWDNWLCSLLWIKLLGKILVPVMNSSHPYSLILSTSSHTTLALSYDIEDKNSCHLLSENLDWVVDWRNVTFKLLLSWVIFQQILTVLFENSITGSNSFHLGMWC